MDSREKNNIDPRDKTILSFITGDLYGKIMWYLC